MTIRETRLSPVFSEQLLNMHLVWFNEWLSESQPDFHS
jgi:hypothetical protein